MPPLETTNTHTPIYRKPIFLLFLIASSIGISFFYPLQAFPSAQIFVTMVLLIIAPLALYVLFKSSIETPSLRFVVPIEIAFCWLALWFINQEFRAPVPALSKEIAAGHLILILGLIASASTAWCVLHSEQSPLSKGQLLSYVCRFFSIAGFGLSFFALYQVWAPSSFPGTFGAMVANLQQNQEFYDPLTFEGLMHALTEGRATGRVGSANIFAGMLALTLPMSLSIFAADKKWWKLFGAISFAICMLAIYESGSRGGLLAAFGGSFIFVVGYYANTVFRRSVTTAVGALILFVSVASTSTSFAEETTNDRWTGTSTIAQRFYYWEIGFDIWQENLFLGNGAGSYKVLYPSYRIPEAQETGFAHNWFVQWGSETGIIGILLFLGLFGSIAFSAVQKGIFLGTERTLALGIVVSIITILAHGLVEFTLSWKEIQLIFGVLLGILLGVSAPAIPISQTPAIPQFSRPAILLIALIGVYCWNSWIIKPTSVESTLELSEFIDDPLERRVMIETTLDRNRKDPRLYELFAFTAAQSNDEALEFLDVAIELNPYSASLQESRSRILENSGKLASAIAAQEKAAELHPFDAMHQLRLAELYWKSSRKEDAVLTFEKTTSLLFVHEQEKLEQERIATLIGIVD